MPHIMDAQEVVRVVFYFYIYSSSLYSNFNRAMINWMSYSSVCELNCYIFRTLENKIPCGIDIMLQLTISRH